MPGTNPSPAETETQISAANPFSGTFPRSSPDTDVFRASTLYWCIIAWTNVLVKKICENLHILLRYNRKIFGRTAFRKTFLIVKQINTCYTGFGNIH